MKKKAQGLSITTIIVAVIALVVLVVLVAIFTGRLGIFSTGVSEVGTCESFGGDCRASCLDEETRVFGPNCAEEEGVAAGNNICCKPK